MKRIPIAIAASLFLASAAHAAFDVWVDIDKPAYTYSVGDLLTIDLTLTTAGPHDVGAFGFLEYQAAWDPTVFEVANAPSGVSANGHSTQTVFPELSGSTQPACFAPGFGEGPPGTNACVTLSQVNAGFSTVTIDGVATAQLVLRVLGGAGFPLSAHLKIGIEQQDAQNAQSITIGPNYTATPEPTAAALIGLGLVGLAAAGRRR